MILGKLCLCLFLSLAKRMALQSKTNAWRCNQRQTHGAAIKDTIARHCDAVNWDCGVCSWRVLSCCVASSCWRVVSSCGALLLACRLPCVAGGLLLSRLRLGILSSPLGHLSNPLGLSILSPLYAVTFVCRYHIKLSDFRAFALELFGPHMPSALEKAAGEAGVAWLTSTPLTYGHCLT